MAEYCSSTDVSNRLTANGYLNLADRDGGGTVSAGELAAYVTPGIVWAGGRIDYALWNHQPAYDLASARASGNAFLTALAVDLACWWIATNGGRDVPEAFQSAYDTAVEMLDAIREKGEEVPGITTGGPQWSDASHEIFEIQSGGLT